MNRTQGSRLRWMRGRGAFGENLAGLSTLTRRGAGSRVALVAVTFLVARPLPSGCAAGHPPDKARDCSMVWFRPKASASMTFALIVLDRPVREACGSSPTAAFFFVVFCSIRLHGPDRHSRRRGIARRSERSSALGLTLVSLQACSRGLLCADGNAQARATGAPGGTRMRICLRRAQLRLVGANVTHGSAGRARRAVSGSKHSCTDLLRTRPWPPALRFATCCLPGDSGNERPWDPKHRRHGRGRATAQIATKPTRTPKHLETVTLVVTIVRMAHGVFEESVAPSSSWGRLRTSSRRRRLRGSLLRPHGCRESTRGRAVTRPHRVRSPAPVLRRRIPGAGLTAGVAASRSPNT